MKTNEEHYSYRVYSNPKVAQDFDTDRFGGPIGEFIKNTQEHVVFSTLPGVKGWKVIDVGAGTGRFTIPFLERGAHVTACDASPHMLEVLQTKAENGDLHVCLSDAHQLNFPAHAFDAAVSFRMLLHVIDWKKALAELCRLSRDWLVFDAPPAHGFLLFAPPVHALRSVFSNNYQSYRIFSLRQLRKELASNGFEIVSLDYGFFLPLMVHRLVRKPEWTRSIENWFARVGLTKHAGSPVTVFARRKK